jgi:hypothetical protein
VNEYVLVFENPFHRRGLVTKVTHQSLTVFFFDHGITKVSAKTHDLNYFYLHVCEFVLKEVPSELTQALPEHFMVQPAFATSCEVAEGEKVWPRNGVFIVVGLRDGRPVVALHDPQLENYVAN